MSKITRRLIKTIFYQSCPNILWVLYIIHTWERMREIREKSFQMRSLTPPYLLPFSLSSVLIQCCQLISQKIIIVANLMNWEAINSNTVGNTAILLLPKPS